MRTRGGFTVGDRVKLSADGLTYLRGGKSKAPAGYTEALRGTVVGFTRTNGLRVLRDGVKNVDGYAKRFWERA